MSLGAHEGVCGRGIEAGISENAQRPNGGKNHKDPEEESIDHHGNILPVLLQSLIIFLSLQLLGDVGDGIHGTL